MRLTLRNSKADDSHPQERELDRREDDMANDVHGALQSWARSLLKGITADTVAEIAFRVGEEKRRQTLHDTLGRHMLAAAEYGVGVGREYVEREIYGTKRHAAIDATAWDLANEDAVRWAMQYVGQLVTGISATTERMIAVEVARWIQNGESFHLLRDRLMDAFVFSPTRAEAIAVTEVTRAFSEGNTAAWQRSNVVEGRRWNTAVDELVCLICGPLHNTIAPLGSSFNGIANPPAHPRCRCWLTPVVDVNTGQRETGLGQHGL